MSTTAVQLVEELSMLRAERDALKAQLEAALKERDEAREERDQARSDRDFIFRDNLRIEKERDEALVKVTWLVEQLKIKRANTTPDPSRLEIAARIMQGWMANDQKYLMTPESDAKSALRIADALIAAAKEVQP